MASLGVRKLDELIGRTDLLDMKKGIEHWKARGLDFSRVFHAPKVPADVARYHVEGQDHGFTRPYLHHFDIGCGNSQGADARFIAEAVALHPLSDLETEADLLAVADQADVDLAPRKGEDALRYLIEAVDLVPIERNYAITGKDSRRRSGRRSSRRIR